MYLKATNSKVSGKSATQEIQVNVKPFITAPTEYKEEIHYLIGH